ncbi:MAG: hypothetical protein LBH07_05835 [Treponema sp.]|nr:hypothetical protein [Treponema sp.]
MGTPPAASYLHEGITVIGDSVTMGARRKMMETIPNCIINAEGSRQMAEGYKLLMQLQNNNSLREYVIIALGTNANSNAPGFIEKIITDIRPGHRLIFVTPFNAAMNSSWITYRIMQYIRTLPENYPFVTVADWAALVVNQPEIFGSDKVHIGGTPRAINLYVNMIIEAIDTAGIKPAK